MTEPHHTLTPPPELVKEWIKKCDKPDDPRWQEYEQDIATLAAQWGADQELEACCSVLEDQLCCFVSEDLRAARRPEPTNLAEEVRAHLDQLINAIEHEGALAMAEPIRRALERLQKLEAEK